MCGPKGYGFLAVLVINKSYICVNLGFFSGISSCERPNLGSISADLSCQVSFPEGRVFEPSPNFDRMKSQLSFVVRTIA